MKTYDPKKITFILGTNIIGGFADGDFIEIEQSEDAFTYKRGADGESVRTRNANNSAKVTVTLLASSASNDVLSAAYVADRLSGNGTLSLLIKDDRGTSRHVAANVWVNKLPQVAYGKEGGTRKWELMADDLINFVGGTTVA